MRAAIGNPSYYRTCGSHFTCDSPMGATDGSEALMLNAPMAQRQARARELLKESGYDGKPLVVLHATSIEIMNQTILVIAQQLRQVGFNVQLASSEWSGVVTRRSVQEPPDKGGWNVFFTWGGGNATSNPIALSAHASNGKTSWFGWPENALNEQLRTEWSAASTQEARRAVAARMNRNMMEYVHDIKTGQWVGPVAYRADRLKGLIAVPEIIPWWNVERIG